MNELQRLEKEWQVPAWDHAADEEETEILLRARQLPDSHRPGRRDEARLGDNNR